MNSKKTIYYFVILLTIFGCQSSKSNFLDIVTKNFNEHSSYISLTVSIDKTEHLIVIENDQLYRLLYDSDLLLIKLFYSFKIKEIISTGNTLMLVKNIDYSLIEVDSLKNNINTNSVDEILKLYFVNGVLKTGVDEKTKNSIIYYLFNNKYICNIDDESGYLVVRKFE